MPRITTLLFKWLVDYEKTQSVYKVLSNLLQFLFQIASAMVACTFVSAPLMFVSAKMITLQKLDPKGYIHNFLIQ